MHGSFPEFKRDTADRVRPWDPCQCERVGTDSRQWIEGKLGFEPKVS